MDEEDSEEDHRLRPAGMRQSRVRQEAQEEQERKRSRVGWRDQVGMERVRSLRPRYDQFGYRSPGTRVKCDRCSWEVPVHAGRLVGLPGRLNFIKDKFRCNECEEEEEPSSQQKEDKFARCVKEATGCAGG